MFIWSECKVRDFRSEVEPHSRVRMINGGRDRRGSSTYPAKAKRLSEAKYMGGPLRQRPLKVLGEGYTCVRTKGGRKMIT